MNSDLLEPGRFQPKVSPVAAHTKPLPISKAEEVKYYHLSVATASMHREDGKKLAFVHGVLATQDAYDQRYLDNEIAVGNSYLSLATQDQIEHYKMTVNPRATIADQVRAEMEPQLREELEKKIRAEILGGAVAGNLDATKIAGTSTATPLDPKVEGQGFRASIVSSSAVADATAGSGTSALTAQQKLEMLKKK